ncbi:MAG: hypothetical protein EOL90_00310 [Spartobacteria bacterium]|nr:hypothetical protein [Spartobacteria bacterium]
MTKKTKTDQRPATVCQLCGRRCGRDSCHYTRGKIITCQDCERTGTGFIHAPEIVFSGNPIHNDTIGSLREQIEYCAGTVDLELGGIVNRLRGEFPKAPERLLWIIAKFDPYRGDKAQHNLREISRLRRRMRRLRMKRAHK